MLTQCKSSAPEESTTSPPCCPVTQLCWACINIPPYSGDTPMSSTTEYWGLHQYPPIQWWHTHELYYWILRPASISPYTVVTHPWAPLLNTEACINIPPYSGDTPMCSTIEYWGLHQYPPIQWWHTHELHYWILRPASISPHIVVTHPCALLLNTEACINIPPYSGDTPMSSTTEYWGLHQYPPIQWWHTHELYYWILRPASISPI